MKTYKLRIKFCGFSLIELMIVITIIGILVSLALPSYESYLKRARFVEVISAVQPFKLAIAMAIQEGISRSELSTGKYGIPKFNNPTVNLKNITVRNGIITAMSTPVVNSATYILKPDDTGMNWKIDGTCLTLGLCKA